EVRRYKAPKEPVWRMVGAIVAGKESTWFFKVIAPGDRLGQVKPEVMSFLRTLRFEESQMRWTLPAGWLEEKGSATREASFRFGSLEPKLEMTVLKLPGDGGGLPANVNRWRGQLGLDRATDSELAASIEKISGVNVEAT